MAPPYFFRSNIIYFARKGPIKVQSTFLAEILYTFNKRSLSMYKFGEISGEQLKV